MLGHSTWNVSPFYLVCSSQERSALMKIGNNEDRSILSRVVQSLPDDLFLRLSYFYRTGRILRLRNPQYLAEKIQWLKIHGKMEQFAPYVDKYTMRAYVAQRVGEGHLVPLLGVWNTYDEIIFDKLPQQFVLKVTNGCGYNYICKNKASINYDDLRNRITAWQKEDFSQIEREKQYKPCVPRIIAEEYLEDEYGELRDYKFWCSKGEPRLIQVDTARSTGHLSVNLDTAWNRRAETESFAYGGATFTPEKPAVLVDMLKIARQLSRGFPFVRVDLYVVRNKIYVGELTFTPGSGFTSRSRSAEIELGKLIDTRAYR
jgi:hypothetical protein